MMLTSSKKHNNHFLSQFMLMLFMLTGMSTLSLNAADVNVNVVNEDGVPVTGFRWQVEEDTTYRTPPGTTSPDSLSFNFHKSYFPIAKNGAGALKGDESGSTAAVTGVDPGGQYYISILPYMGHSLGGAPLAVPATGPVPDVTVIVKSNPIPTAQISIFVFEDNQVANGAPDLPQEEWDVAANGTSPAQDFSVKIFDAGGQYGIAGGQVTQDVFGNPLGTTYLPNGDVDFMPTTGFVLHPNAQGVILVKNLAPGKYAVEVVPPAGQGWSQTSTIEGSKAIDAWVKADEPSFFVEFGPPGHHVFMGFVKDQNDFANNAGGANISGLVTNLHMSRPPAVELFSSYPFPACRIALNDGPALAGKMLYTAACEDINGIDSRSEFNIQNVPPGNYDLVVFDDNMSIVIATHNITVNPDLSCSTPTGSCALGDVSVFNWFARVESSVFFDFNGNGFRDPGDVPMGADSAAVTLRFRDGRVYQSFPVDGSGEAPFDAIFPFFHWLVAEVDFAKLKATGATFTIDDGGMVPAGETLAPQPQVCTLVQSTNPDDPDFGCTVGAAIVNPNTGDNLSRTETGPVLTAGFQAFLGQTNRMEFGKTVYGPGENGGISGIVFYAITRAEDDPAFAAAEEWEPGIPRVQVNLYKDVNLDGVIDDVNAPAGVQLADVDNYPFGWSEGGAMGPEDVNNSGTTAFDLGDAIRITHTDSWDDSVPTGCQGDEFPVPGHPGSVTDCYDGLRNFNQVRPGVFNGGYAFGPGDLNDPQDLPLVPGTYIVEAVAPAGLVNIRPEDKNVDFGDEFTPDLLLLPPVCVGNDVTVPDYVSFQTDDTGAGLPGIAVADLIDAPFAGTVRKLCDRKQIKLSNSQNAAADFHMFSKVPKAAHVVGGILNDVANEFDPNSPVFGEKFAPPWLPVAFYDWTGAEINRVHADEFGKFNALLPSTYTVNVPSPSGMSPNMITACMNDAGQVPNPNFDPGDPTSIPTIIDPYFDRQYTQFCYTFQYMPAATTYLDTPVLSLSAFTGPGNPLDCEQAAGTPMVAKVTGGAGPYGDPGDELTIRSAGILDVLNPEYTGLGSIAPRFISRNYNFGGAQGTVTLGGVNMPITHWGGTRVTATIPAGMAAGSYQLELTNGAGVTSPIGVTVTVSPTSVRNVNPSANPAATPIQDAIDAASAGELIILKPGTYNEIPIMYKPVKLQGYGAFSTTINARKVPGDKLQVWRDKVTQLEADGEFDLLPGQENMFNQANNEPALLFDGEGAGITVVSQSGNTKPNSFNQARAPRIDGVTITGADHGGAIFVGGYADWLQISNNRLMSNHGTAGGGIRVGFPALVAEDGNNGLAHVDARNDDISIHHNLVNQNGSGIGAGGGIALYTGADRYEVTNNWICGNFATAPGGGIGHLGFSRSGLIEDNTIVFNQSFKQGQNVNGGGLFVGGKAGIELGSASPGSGTTDIISNLILGNQAGAGDGGGIALENINGQDILNNPGAQGSWYHVDILNNMIANNMAGDAGGGVSLQDAVRVNIANNTIANNDSTATVGTVLTNNGNSSDPQPAGLVSMAHVNIDTGIMGTVPARFKEPYSNPNLQSNIIWHNRSFTWDGPNLGLLPDIAGGDAPVYDDIAVLGFENLAGDRTEFLDPRRSIFSPGTVGPYHANNQFVDPEFIRDHVKGSSNLSIFQQEPTTNFTAAAAFDEGGNFIDIRFGPLTLIDPSTGDPYADYHIGPTSPAINAGRILGGSVFNELVEDFDDDPRNGPVVDVGADERI